MAHSTDRVDKAHAALFGPLPTRGIWTAVALTRNQFLLILGLSVALFVFTGGPLWAHVHDSHFARIGISYVVIPIATAAALYRNARLSLTRLLGASAVLALIKLVLTAALLVAIGLAQA